MTHEHSCPTESRFRAYFYQNIFVAFIILCQLLLFIQTIRQEVVRKRRSNSSNNNKSNEPTVRKQLRILYVILQLLGLYWTMSEFFRYTVFVTSSTSNHTPPTFVCGIIGVTPLFLVHYFYGTYVYLILCRLYYSFENSFLAIKRCTFIVLACIIVVSYFLAGTAFGIIKASEGTCLHPWYPPDTASHRSELLFCSVPITMYDRGTQALSATLTALFNAVFTVIFCVKLQKLLSMDKGQVPYRRIAFKSLIVKICILTIVGFVSTVVSWVCVVKFRATVGLLFVYTDVFINCLINGLMFKYNERVYRKLCKYCISSMFALCGDGKKKENQMERMTSRSSAYLDVDGSSNGGRGLDRTASNPPKSPKSESSNPASFEVQHEDEMSV